MVSKTRKQRQKMKVKTAANGGVRPPAATPLARKSVHDKKVRPNMKRKNKWRLGLDSPIDIYEGFDERKGVLWVCPQCHALCRTVGYCVDCATGVKRAKVPLTSSAAGGSSSLTAADGSVEDDIAIAKREIAKHLPNSGTAKTMKKRKQETKRALIKASGKKLKFKKKL